MPGGDGTGPRGFGPMTGRAAGLCTGSGVPGYANFVAGRGCRAWGGGRGGGGRGFRNWFYGTGLTGWQRAGGYMPAWSNPFVYGGPSYIPTTPPTAAATQQELAALKAQAEYLEDVLEGIRRQLKDLESQDAGPRGG